MIVKDIPEPGFSKYKICKRGRIYSEIKHKYIHPWTGRKGYKIIELHGDDGSTKRFPLHRLVAKAFIPNPDDLPQVNHKDENKANNHSYNLEWCDNAYNEAYGTRGERIGNALRGRGRPIVMLDDDGNVVKRYSNQMEPFRLDGYYQPNINKVLNGIKKKAYGYKFMYEDEYHENAKISRHN